MAGIYFHIPFCRQACFYCDFHFSTNQRLIEEVIKAMIRELTLRKDYIPEEIETIYFGGGTPSLLGVQDISHLLNVTMKYFKTKSTPEITLEANPDDLTLEKLRELKSVGINRLSIGVQSFNNEILKYLNRIHDSNTAIESFEKARKCNFDNLNIDLIFAIRKDHKKILQNDLDIVAHLSPEHISAYCLTVEPRTVFGNWIKKGRFFPVPDEEAAQEFEWLMNTLAVNGYDQYEISNFAKPGKFSRHNLNYWQHIPYLGIGPSAHSYNLETRQYNVNNNSLYVKSLQDGILPATIDYLTPKERINEYIMTSLRTKWGCDLDRLSTDFNYFLLVDFKDYISNLIQAGFARLTLNRLILEPKGKLIADKIASDFFIV